MKEKINDNLRVFVVPVQILEDQSLTIHEKMVYMVLRSFVNPHRSEAFPSHKTICNMSGIKSITTVKKAISLLSEKGYISQSVRFDYNHRNKTARQTSNLYKLDLPLLPQLGGDPSQEMATPQSGDGYPPSQEMATPQSGDGYQDHNHLTNQLELEEDVIKSVADMSISELAFEKLIMQNKISKDVRKRILKSLPAHIDNYPPAVILATFKRAMNKITRITDLPSWFASAIENEKLRLDQQAIEDKVFEQSKAKYGGN